MEIEVTNYETGLKQSLKLDDIYHYGRAGDYTAIITKDKSCIYVKEDYTTVTELIKESFGQ